jgi:hypothetical protein
VFIIITCMFVRVDSFIYIFPLFYSFFLMPHCSSFVLFYDLFSLAFVSTVYRFVYKSGRHGRYPMLVRFTTTYAISAYQRWRYDFKSCSIRCVLDTTLCDKVYQQLATGRSISRDIPATSSNKTDHHDETFTMLEHIS